MTTTTIKTILTLESVLQRVKEIGIAARHETYAAIADRIFLTPACIEEIRNAMRLAPVSEDIRAEMLQLPAEVEAKRAANITPMIRAGLMWLLPAFSAFRLNCSPINFSSKRN